VAEAKNQADVPSGYTALIEYAKIVVPLSSGIAGIQCRLYEGYSAGASRMDAMRSLCSWLSATSRVVAGLLGLGTHESASSQDSHSNVVD